MHKKILFAIIASVGIISTASSQTLFTYGKYTADAKDFLRAFNKNNAQPVANKAKAINDYLDLYIKSRLKIREAYDRGYDSLPQIKLEVNNLRTQIADNYMNDQEMAGRLQQEAFQRSLKDIHVAHIFISFKNAAGAFDSASGKNKRDEILRRLQKGEDFLIVAQQVSDDPAAKNNKGDLGYITAFTLPYEFESVIYATAPGKFSAPVTSKIGYHIFKNLGERKAVGKIKVQQILLAIPPGADEATKKDLQKKADSLYKVIMAGGNFDQLASKVSNDYISAANNGIMPDISVGKYDPIFENAVWSLPKNGAVSKPFLTSHGWHIVKRIAIIPVITDPANKTNKEDINQRIIADSRWKVSDNFIYERVIKKAGHQRKKYNEAGLWSLTDSLLDNKPMNGNSFSLDTPLFSIGDSVYDATGWINFVRSNRYKQDGTGNTKPYEQLKEDYIKFALRNYYRDHLEEYNADFNDQMTEFKDGNLFFEIMQEEIWNKAQADSVGLADLYNKNKAKYTWKQSADAVIFFCSDQAIAKSAFDQLKKNPADWRKVTELYPEKVIADSSRYEWNQIPNLNKMAPAAGMITTQLLNKNDNTASFAYIVKAYAEPMPRSFNEARGLVISDYQTLLEDKWIAELKKKYPVVINQKVLADISK